MFLGSMRAVATPAPAAPNLLTNGCLSHLSPKDFTRSIKQARKGDLRIDRTVVTSLSIRIEDQVLMDLVAAAKSVCTKQHLEGYDEQCGPVLRMDLWKLSADHD